MEIFFIIFFQPRDTCNTLILKFYVSFEIKLPLMSSTYLVIVGPKPLKAKINRILEHSVYSKGSTLYASVILYKKKV